MRRTSSDAEYLEDGTVTVDADGIPVTLSGKADKTYVDQVVPIRILTGQGTPEGRVTAPVGSSYTDSAGTNGAVRWVKTSGTGNIGWRVEYGDTGWRDITSLITSSPALIMGTGAKIAIRRAGGSVFFRVIGPATMGGTFGNIVAAQTGLRPDLDTNSPAAKGASFRNTRSWIRLEDGTRDVVLVESGRAVETMWSTTEAWPATLPGTPL